MGQPISKEMMETLKKRPDVAALSAQHIWLVDGRVLDPSEYLVHVWPIVYVMKFVSCVCGGGHQGLIVYSLVEHGLLPAVRIGIGRGVLRFTDEDIDRFIQNCRSPKRRREPATRPA